MPQGDMDPNSYEPNPQSTPDGTMFHFPDLTPAIPEPVAGQLVIRAVPHPGELNSRGIPITCSQCAAGRDWLLLSVGPQVFVRCRCAYEWPEDLDLEFFESVYGTPQRAWADFDQAVTGLGFDGLLAGAIWE
ncbi:hypothetical protein [Kitasatospora sp. GAS1066B]|uniref:hypothetical protein n=1 Tax=Kitasatospora sp. GAS1066B TaxID=3156271 RepID=UPI0035129883